MKKKLKLEDWSNDITLNKLLTVGDVIDEKFYNLLVNSVPPKTYNQNLFQMGEMYDFCENEAGKMQPTYMTFTKDKESEGWIYQGACFANEIKNRHPEFEINHMEMGTYEEEDPAQIITKTLVSLAKLEDKYNIPSNQRITVYEEVKGDSGTTEIYPFARDDKTDKDAVVCEEALIHLDEARNENHLLIGLEYSALARHYTLETIFNMFSKEQKEMIINDVNLYGGLVVDEHPVAIKDGGITDKLIDMVMSERKQEQENAIDEIDKSLEEPDI